jgi:hypothetical protein
MFDRSFATGDPTSTLNEHSGVDVMCLCDRDIVYEAIFEDPYEIGAALVTDTGKHFTFGLLALSWVDGDMEIPEEVYVFYPERWMAPWAERIFVSLCGAAGVRKLRMMTTSPLIIGSLTRGSIRIRDFGIRKDLEPRIAELLGQNRRRHR